MEYFRKTFQVRCLTRFWIQFCIFKNELLIISLPREMLKVCYYLRIWQELWWKLELPNITSTILNFSKIWVLIKSLCLKMSKIAPKELRTIDIQMDCWDLENHSLKVSINKIKRVTKTYIPNIKLKVIFMIRFSQFALVIIHK